MSALHPPVAVRCPFPGIRRVQGARDAAVALKTLQRPAHAVAVAVAPVLAPGRPAGCLGGAAP